MGISPAQRPSERRVETSSVRAFQGVEDISDALATVDAALKDPLAFAERELGTILRQTSGSRGTFHRFYPPEHPGSARYPTLRLEASQFAGAGATERIQLELELLAHSSPYQDLTDLFSDFNLPVQAAAEDAPCTVDLILAPVAEIDAASELKNDTLRVVVRAAPNVERVGVKSFGRESINRFSVEGSDLDWVADSGILRGGFVKPLQGVPLALIALSYGGEFVHRWWLRDETRSFSNRFELHRAADPSGVFRATFFDQRNDFEERVGVLVTLLGLTPLKYGQIAQLTNAPDIIAASPNGHVYIIECTTGDINSKGKLQRLSDRAKALAGALEHSPARPRAILPVVVTSSPRNETAAHWSVAANLRIALVCREELTQLLTQLEAPPTPDELYADALSLIPPTSPK